MSGGNMILKDITFIKNEPVRNKAIIEDCLINLKLIPVKTNSKELINEIGLANLIKNYRGQNTFNIIREKVLRIDKAYNTMMQKRCQEKGKDFDEYIDELSNIILSRNSIDINLINEFKNKREYSFITKYCSWHFPEKFVIYDSKVRSALTYYQTLGLIDKKYKDFVNIDYQALLNIINNLISYFELEEVLSEIEKENKEKFSKTIHSLFFNEFLISLKLFDKYLWYIGYHYDLSKNQPKI
jgi:hypothetical protein